MTDKYILVGHEPVAEPDLIVWTKWCKKSNRVIKNEKFEGRGMAVKTVFLVLDHSFEDGTTPIVFETMVFGGEFDGWQRRYCTWQQSVVGHDDCVASLLAGKPLDLHVIKN